jgi:hypothetical protein
MAHGIASWWAFSLEGEPAGAAPTVLSFLGPPLSLGGVPSLLLLWLAFFAALHAALRARLPLPAHFSAADRAAAVAWAAAFFHHVPVVLLALAALGAPAPGVPLWALAAAVPFTIAYVVADTVATCAPQVMAGDYEMALHHGLGLLVAGAALLAPPALLRWAPHMWVCEMSNVGLGVSWFARKAGLEGSAAQRGGEAFFVAAFVLTRVVSLPAAVYSLTVLQWAPVARAMGAGVAGACAAALWLIVGLQMYWLARIARMLLARRKKAPPA